MEQPVDTTGPTALEKVLTRPTGSLFQFQGVMNLGEQGVESESHPGDTLNF
jgi:hypothetical protein